MANDVARMILKFAEASNIDHLKRSYIDKHYKFSNELKYLLFDKIYAKNKENNYINIDSVQGVYLEELSNNQICRSMGNIRKRLLVKYRAKTQDYSETEDETYATLSFVDERYMDIFFNFIKAYDLRLICTFHKYQHILCISWEHWKVAEK